MNYKMLLILNLLCFPAFSQTQPYKLKDALTNIPEILSYNPQDSTVKIYFSDFHSIDSLVKLSKKQYKVVLFYAFWCDSCRNEMPGLISFFKEHQNNFELFLITGDKYDRLIYNYRYLKNHLFYYKPAFILDKNIYGEKSRGLSRITNFISQLCSECNTRKMAYCSYIVFDSSNKFLFHTTWEFTREENLKALKKLPLASLL
ncbi:redoxin domain-containing protein [Solitalea sp. MAHUQ-68]|uniref:Redoxin domain-containing protein n=1 Tax=Solitalea agri TaxID=2953739 RepID=A0A9X2F3G7_9SPHI|nr:redoxin domain-containing protein [Solitalea agri]MCO4293539.1 redoxin domain-containing protein [Solitalea agri]